jgi:Flp pilus assembly protein TadG
MNTLQTTNRYQIRANQRRGAAIIELSIVLPVILLIVLGTIETCSMIFLKQSLKIAAYEGARVAIVPQSTVSEIEATVEEMLVSRRVKGASIQVTPNDYANSPYGTFVNVTVTAPCELNSLVSLGFYGGQSFSGSVEMMKEFDK